MWSKLQEIFDELEQEYEIPYSRQGSYAEDEELPTSFYTFWNQNSSFGDYYSNKPTNCDWDWLIFFYTKDASMLYTGLELFIKKALEKGFFVEGSGKDISCDEPNYSGRYLKVTFEEELTN